MMNLKIAKSTRIIIKRLRLADWFTRIEENRSWRAYGNTKGKQVNQKYESYIQYCRQTFQAAGNEPVDVSKSPLEYTGAVHIKGALESEAAHNLSDTFTGLIEQRKGLQTPPSYSHLMTGLARPVDSLGMRLLDIFDNPNLDSALTGYFGSYYRLEWMDCYRSHPTPDVGGSWLWHVDDVPMPIVKVMLHLTDAGLEQGATQFINASHTRAYGLKGYSGVRTGDRTDDLGPFTRKKSLPFEPFHHEAKAGDALIFNTNLLHRAVPPSTEYRDVSTIFVMPNPIPWREQFERDGVDRLQTTEKTWPADPRPAN
jgi:hypothetical protein